MIRDYFWLNDDQFSHLEPLLPTDTRGNPRVDDCRVISGIVHVLKSGEAAGRTHRRSTGRTKPSTTGLCGGRPRACGPIFSMLWRRPTGAGADRLISRQGPSLCQRRKRGELTQAIGRSRGGRTTKIHALSDGECRPIAFLLTGGQVADCKAGSLLLEQMPPSLILNGDKGYDSNAIRRQVEERGVMPNIPPKVNQIGRAHV